MLRIILIIYIVFFGNIIYAQEDFARAKMEEAKEFYFAHDPEKALQMYIDISKDSPNRQAFLNATFIALELNRPKEAVDIAKVGYTLYPQDEEISDMLAEAFLADGQYAAAEKIVSLLPQNLQRTGFYHIHLARAQIGLNEYSLAKYNLKRALLTGTHTGLSNYLLGHLYLEEKNYQQAANAFEKAIQYDHQFTEARRNYAQTLEQLGRYEEAYKQYKMIYAAEKKDKQTNAALARLKKQINTVSSEKQSDNITLSHTSVLPLSSNSAREIKIGLGMSQSGKPPSRNNITFKISVPFTVTNSKGKIIATGKTGEEWKVILQKKQPALIAPSGSKFPFKNQILITPKSDDTTQAPTFILKDIMSGAGMTWFAVSDKEYRGKLQIIYNTRLNTLVPVNILPLDDYLLGIISSEMPIGFPLEALRAQAVLARTYALRHLGKHKAYGFDLCDSQNCQVYGGVSAESENGNEAVSSTLGEILLFEGKPIESVFSANTGGITQSSKNAGWSDIPYLQSVSDYKQFDFENLQPYQFKELLQYPVEAYSHYDKNVSLAAFRWTRVIDAEDLYKIIKQKKKDIGQITALIPLERSKSGYISKLIIKGTKGEIILNKENIIRNNLSLGMLRSSYFIVEPNYQNHKLKYFIFYGGGWGHGVGFDQTGAAGRAEEGQDYKTILHHYFPLAEFSKKYN